jgi:uncharacterized protein YecE (DUF72 family)
MRTYIGISGWRYAPWRGVFYPEGLKQDDELAYAGKLFDTIEINGSFYSLQRPESYERWYAAVPADFVFAVKGSRYISHMLRLKNVRTALANFFASGVLALREKLGPILWQFPPNFAYKREVLETFFAMLPQDGEDAARLARKHDRRVAGRAFLKIDAAARLRHAIEVRHESFVRPEFIALLRRYRIAIVVADTAGKWPFFEDVTADFAYVRLHGDKKIYESGYSDAALDVWAAKIRAWLGGVQASGARAIGSTSRGRDVFVYFDNDMKVHAPFDAARLAARVAASTIKGRSRPRAHRRAGT